MNRLTLIFVTCLPVLTAAQAESGKQTLLRFTSFGLQDAGGEYVLAVGDVPTSPFTIPDNGFSAPVPAPGAGNALALGRPGDTPFRRLAAITLPETGKHFLVMVFPGENETLRTLVVRADDPAFRPGNVMILNLSSQTLAGDLGGEKLRFEPGKQAIFRPRRKDDLANYQVRFYQSRGGKPKVFAASLWPYFEKKRAFVFLYADPASGFPTYRSIDEFTDWLEEG
jgi:hypothetical protein